ncbi:MAG TPA: hypothetical protein VFR78_08615 [Pyrinomonadaceae bacterium]|nr:hypothetical protein [Pyrinomonadaceae bacterium]
MKYLIIAALVGLVFVLIYARVRPYLKLIREVKSAFEERPQTTAVTNRTNQLVRCEGCNTWIPADRALSLKSGLATFCSTECMAKTPASKPRKIAG